MPAGQTFLSTAARRRVAVIGAGISGLASAKCLLEEGFIPVVFEQATRIGGVWTFDESLPEGGGPAYRSLITNTSKQTTAYSDFPFPADFPDFPARASVECYLCEYAERFRVREHIRFGTRVEAVIPAEEGRWTVRTCKDGICTSDTFDAVFICSGVFHDPVLPSYEGLEHFTGTILHSRAYIDAEMLAGQSVVIVGTGSSGVDIAIEAGQVAKQVFMSSRGGLQAATRAVTVASSKHARWQQFQRRLRLVKTRLQRRRMLSRRQRAHGVETPFTQDAPFSLEPIPFMPKDKLRQSISDGQVILKPGIERMEGNTIVFSDGSSSHVDILICATGYGVSYPFLDTSIVQADATGLPLYRLIFPPTHPTLAFIGMFRVTGPAPPVAEMQARWAASVIRGAINLPAIAEMRAAIELRRAEIARRGTNPYRLNAEAYQDMLATELGVLPQLWRHPRLVGMLLAGPPIAAQYRLDGPGRWSGAAHALIDAQ